MIAGQVQIFTDGACLGHLGSGGWVELLRARETEKKSCRGEPDTINKRMRSLLPCLGSKSSTGLQALC